MASKGFIEPESNTLAAAASDVVATSARREVFGAALEIAVGVTLATAAATAGKCDPGGMLRRTNIGSVCEDFDTCVQVFRVCRVCVYHAEEGRRGGRG